MTAFFLFDAASVSPGAERRLVSGVTVKITACVNGHRMDKLIASDEHFRLFLLGAWVPRGLGRFALQSAKRIRNGRHLINKNIQQVTFNGHCNESNNELTTN